MGKKNLTIEEMFCANFYLKSYFKNMEYKIKKSREMGEDERYKEWEKQRQRWIKAFQEMNIEDLKIVYYMQNIRELRSYRIALTLKKISEGLDELNNIMGQEYLF